jgi:hypothetical protein
MTSKGYTVYGDNARGIETPLETRELDDAKNLARRLARIMAMGGYTGRMLVRADDGYMVYSIKVRGRVEVISDDALGGDEALYLDGEYAYMPSVKSERARFISGLRERVVTALIEAEQNDTLLDEARAIAAERYERIAADVGCTPEQVADVEASLAAEGLTAPEVRRAVAEHDAVEGVKTYHGTAPGSRPWAPVWDGESPPWIDEAPEPDVDDDFPMWLEYNDIEGLTAPLEPEDYAF